MHDFVSFVPFNRGLDFYKSWSISIKCKCVCKMGRRNVQQILSVYLFVEWQI